MFPDVVVSPFSHLVFSRDESCVRSQVMPWFVSMPACNPALPLVWAQMRHLHACHETLMPHLQGFVARMQTLQGFVARMHSCAHTHRTYPDVHPSMLAHARTHTDSIHTILVTYGSRTKDGAGRAAP